VGDAVYPSFVRSLLIEGVIRGRQDPMARSSRAGDCYWLSPLLDPALSKQLGGATSDSSLSSSKGLQTHSLRRLRLPCTGVADPSSSSMIARLSFISSSVLWRLSLPSESDESDGSSSFAVGMISSSGSWKMTLLTGGNIFLGVRADVAETCRLGNGLLRRMLRAPNGRK